MKVGIYHPFNDLPDNYSLSHVVREQMYMLTEHGHECHFVTSKGFHAEVPPDVVVHAVLPRKNIFEAAEPVLKDLDVVLTHDVVYLPVYIEHDKVIRKITVKHPNLRWLHWSHSAPNPKDQRTPIPNSLYIGMNYTDLFLLAEQYQTPVARCQVVYNSASPDLFFDWHPFTRMLVEKYRLLENDILITYPLDTGRFTAKGGQYIIQLVECFRTQGKKAAVVFVNAAANTEERRELVQNMQRGKHVVFTSLVDKQYETCVPRRVVKELMELSNLFPLLSQSEGCSLTMLEAALTKNLIVLNAAFPPMKEFGELDNVLYMEVGSTRAKTHYSTSEAQYFEEKATEIINKLDCSPALRFNRKVLQRFNREWIWKNQLEPLLQWK